MKKLKSSSKIQRKLYDLKVAKLVMAAAADPYRPLVAHFLVTKRCNLSCAYCFEYDKTSAPIPIDILKARIDEFKRLKVVFVTLNGGEPLLHPNIVELVQYIYDIGLVPMMNSNGFLLKIPLIEALNKAGLYAIQISCDGMKKNETSRKTMDILYPKLSLLAEHAAFKVRVNTVLGACPAHEAIEAVQKVLDLGFDAQCSLVRDSNGAALPLTEAHQDAYFTIRKMRGRLPAILNDGFQIPLVNGEENTWKCRSGARYFHIDEDGLVHLCQPRSGFPAKHISEYNKETIKACFHMYKPCSKRCAHAYAHIGSRLDTLRPQEHS